MCIRDSAATAAVMPGVSTARLNKSPPGGLKTPARRRPTKTLTAAPSLLQARDDNIEAGVTQKGEGGRGQK